MLRSKLRKLSILQDDPDAVRLLIDDLMYHFLVRKPHPNALWYIQTQSHSYWLRTIGSSPVEEGQQLVFSSFPVLGEGDTGFQELTPQQEEAVIDAVQYSSAFKLAAEEWLREVLHGNRSGIENIIISHRPQELVHGVFKCACKRDFEHRAAWAKHLRIRIERYLLNTFAPGEEEPVSAE
jgi:hypothetical protein